MIIWSSLVGTVTRWPVESQQRARRNAMIASTALAQRRAETDEVEEFLISLSGSRGGSPASQRPLRWHADLAGARTPGPGEVGHRSRDGPRR